MDEGIQLFQAGICVGADILLLIVVESAFPVITRDIRKDEISCYGGGVYAAFVSENVLEIVGHF